MPQHGLEFARKAQPRLIQGGALDDIDRVERTHLVEDEGAVAAFQHTLQDQRAWVDFQVGCARRQLALPHTVLTLARRKKRENDFFGARSRNPGTRAVKPLR